MFEKDYQTPFGLFLFATSRPIKLSVKSFWKVNDIINISEESCGSYFDYQKYDHNRDMIFDFTQKYLQSQNKGQIKII